MISLWLNFSELAGEIIIPVGDSGLVVRDESLEIGDDLLESGYGDLTVWGVVT